jgi:catechol 2,3-dioxygenase-like lactoylglutathione lyase family enzyme
MTTDDVGAGEPGGEFSPPEPPPAGDPNLGHFSVSLAVSDLAVSQAFYEQIGFEPLGGGEGWIIMRQGGAMIGLFEGMFEGNILTFNPPDVRAVQARLAERGLETELLHEMPEGQDPAVALPATEDEGPAHIVLEDPDGNSILFDQF